MSDNQFPLTASDKKSRLSNLLDRARTLAPKAKMGGAQFVYHSAWIGLLGLSFIDPNLLSNPLAAVVFGGLGVEMMGDLISKIIDEPDDDKFIALLEDVIAKSNVGQALSRDDLRAELMAVTGGIGTAIEIAVQSGNVRVARILVRETDRVLEEVRQSRVDVLDRLDDLAKKIDSLSGPLQAVDITKPSTTRLIKIFISSPGDVPQERKIAQEVIDTLRYDPMLQGKVYFDVIAWDKPGASTPMLATMTPQEAINQGLAKPSDCDIVVVIFWSRMGTPLPHPEYQKSDGTQYLSGTEWEFWNAYEAGKADGLPLLVVYRRMDEPQIGLRDTERDKKIEQFERVEKFFTSFTNTDGSIKQGYNQYQKPEDFRREFETHLRKLVARLLEAQPKQPEPKKSGIPAKQTPIWKGSPFPGLRAFTENEAPIFFGRGRETDKLVQMVEQSRFVAVVGASGSGKSSLVGAGLIPRLRENAIDGSRDWHIVRCTPGEKPFLSLAEALIETIPALIGDPVEIATRAEKLAGILRSAPDNLDKTIKHVLKDEPDWSQVLIFIDQFEELLTLTTADASEPFGKILTYFSDKIRVVVTLRADFYHRMLPLLEEPLRDGNFTLAKPSPIALYEMIVRPAERAGIVFEDGLAERIVHDTGDEPGSLALMAYLLDELYNVDDDKVLTHQEYEDLGGVAKVIGTRAESVWQTLQMEETILHQVFYRLIEVDEGIPIRRRYVFQQTDENDNIYNMINAFIKARLLTSNENAQGATVEVAHEALLREWGRLANWVAERQVDFQIISRMRRDAYWWASRGRPHQDLPRAEQLDEFYSACENLKIDLDVKEDTLLVEYAAQDESERLIQSLAKGELDERRFNSVMYRLEQIGADLIMANLTALLNSEVHKDVRDSIFEVLPELLKDTKDEQIIKLLIDNMTNSTHITVRANAASALERLGDKRAVAMLIVALEDESTSVRVNVASALGRLGDRRAVVPLIDILKSDISTVRSSAASALGRLGDRRAVVPLIDILKSDISRVRSSAASALGRLGDERAVVLLIAALGDESTSVRSSAASALGRLGDERAVAPLITALDDKVISVRAEALVSIHQLSTGTPDVVCQFADEETIVYLIQRLSSQFGSSSQISSAKYDFMHSQYLVTLRAIEHPLAQSATAEWNVEDGGDTNDIDVVKENNTGNQQDSQIQDKMTDGLINQFNSGDEKAWQFIVDSYRKRLQAICVNSQIALHMDIDVLQAEDITQEAWTILYNGIKTNKNHFENIGQIIKWMRETQHNLLRNLRRKASTRNEKPLKEDDEYDNPPI